jgi:FixJ family two-component response regulator
MPHDTSVVFIVDDDVSVRKSLELLVESAGWATETFGSAQAFLARPRASGPCCLVLDVYLPDLSGLELQTLVADRTEMPVIFITGCGDVPTTVRAMKAGAVEFLTKPVVAEPLLAAIRGAIDRSRAELERAVRSRESQTAYASLSRREQEVMALVVSGRLNKQVGGQLGISEITVKAHRGRVMRKMHARSLSELVRMADSLTLAGR